MNRNSRAEQIYNNLICTKIPGFSGDDTLDDWIEDLIAYDTFLAGLVARAAAGEKLQYSEVPDISLLKKNLANIAVKFPDFAKITECTHYLFLLTEAFDFLSNGREKIQP